MSVMTPYRDCVPELGCLASYLQSNSITQKERYKGVVRFADDLQHSQYAKPSSTTTSVYL